MRPDVARAFDRMERAARADGISLIITSAFRSDAEQAVLFARHPDPRWVAPPGRSLHRLGTELDLGPPAAYGWLAANAPRFHFVQRYAWEDWHCGYVLNAHSSPPPTADGAGGEHAAVVRPALPTRPRSPGPRSAGTSPPRCSPRSSTPNRTSTRSWSAARARRGSPSSCPARRRRWACDNPFDAEQAIDAQAHLMRDLLRRFPAIPLALAAYNAGPTPVAACGCVPANGETPGYVARILGLMAGAGRGRHERRLEVRLVE